MIDDAYIEAVEEVNARAEYRLLVDARKAKLERDVRAMARSKRAKNRPIEKSRRKMRKQSQRRNRS